MHQAAIAELDVQLKDLQDENAAHRLAATAAQDLYKERISGQRSRYLELCSGFANLLLLVTSGHQTSPSPTCTHPHVHSLTPTPTPTRHDLPTASVTLDFLHRTLPRQVIWRVSLTSRPASSSASTATTSRTRHFRTGPNPCSQGQRTSCQRPPSTITSFSHMRSARRVDPHGFFVTTCKPTLPHK